MALGGWGYPQWYILWNRSYRRADALSRFERRRTWAGTEWRLADVCRNGRPGTLPMGLATSEHEAWAQDLCAPGELSLLMMKFRFISQ